MTFKIDEKVLKQVESLAAQGLSEEQIGSVIGCSRETIRRRKRDNAAFEAAIKNGKAKGVAKVSNALFQKAVNGDTTSMIFFLKNRDSQNWRDKQVVEQTNTNTNYNIPDNTDPVEAARMYQEALKSE